MTGLDEIAEDGYAMLELLGRKRGMLISGGEVNLELRSPDSTSNPYLVFALCLAAGMEGIENGMKTPEELTKDIRKLN